MTAATCSRGHVSSTMDYCDVCGVPMSRGSAAPVGEGAEAARPASAVGVPAGQGSGAASASGGAEPAGQPAPAAAPCPHCGTPRAGRFCEEDGYDFLLAPPAEGVDPDASGPVRARAEPGTGGPVGSGDGSPASGQGTAWLLVVDADPGYFDLVTSFGGTDAASLTFPRFVVPRGFTLEPRQLLIGRRSRSRGVQPDIDLVGPPEDPGVSHLHALLLPQPGGWAVVDLGSANGTYLNDPSTPPIVANTAVPLGDGDRVYLGAWTRLTIRADR
ncbi:FHA domain-containing protein [Plantactinospora sp. BC1]|uniref:FHA domain-containing protein n=1 Tax=Plantactinospora sp. BC1 TaxID=2108470 RepID=UPI0018FE956A|nr:FHA domain-containing protein [Plantactinospora sp. BC1]